MSDDEPKPRRGRPRTMDNDKTLDAAMQAYWRTDPQDVSINAICEIAGVSKPSLYRQFGSEDGLMRAVLDRYADQVLSEAFTLLQTDPPFDDLMEALIAYASADPKMETGCLYYKMRAGKHRLGPLTRARVEEIEAQAQAGYAQYLEAQRAAGTWASDLPAEVAARYIVEQIGMALSQRAAGQERATIRASLILALSALRTR